MDFGAISNNILQGIRNLGQGFMQGAQNVGNAVGNEVQQLPRQVTNYVSQDIQRAPIVQNYNAIRNFTATPQFQQGFRNVSNAIQNNPVAHYIGSQPLISSPGINVLPQPQMPTIGQYVNGQIVKPLEQGLSNIFQAKNIGQAGQGALQSAGGAFGATPGGFLFNVTRGGVAGAINAAKGQPLDQAITQGITQNSSIGQAVTKNPFLAMGIDVASANPEGIANSLVKSGNFVKALTNSIPDAEIITSQVAKAVAPILGKIDQGQYISPQEYDTLSATAKAILNPKTKADIQAFSRLSPEQMAAEIKTAFTKNQSYAYRQLPGYQVPGMGLVSKDTTANSGSEPILGNQNIKTEQTQPQSKIAVGEQPVSTETKVVSQNVSSQPIISQEKQRGFLQSAQSVGANEVKQAAGDINPQTYTPLTNKASLSSAKAAISKDANAAHQFVLSNAPYDAKKAATAELLMNKYAENGQFDKFKEITDSLDNQARTAGQGIQILSNWDQMSPKAILNVANKEAENINKPLTEDFQKQIVQRAAEIQKMPLGSSERITAQQNLLKDIATQLPSSKLELFKSYRYQNMLSNPVTLGKIAYSGLFNTMVTRPIDLFGEATIQKARSLFDTSFQRTVSYSDIPKWYKSALVGVPNAWNAALEGFKNHSIDEAFAPGLSGGSTLQRLRTSNMPGALTFFPRLHSFLYNYTKSIVAGAEKTRLMQNGVGEEEAAQQAQALADKLTLRSANGKPAPGEAWATRAVDSIGNMISQSSRLPAIGGGQSWVAPFMRVSTNWTKLAVEHSPLALPDTLIGALKGNEGADQAFAHAAMGSLVTGIGTYLAMSDRVTLAAPTDRTQNANFYASGRKPYSVNIPGLGWVPMQYFGPFALSMMIPAVVKDAVSGTNASKSTTDQLIAGITDATKMIVSSTPLPTIAGFFNLLSGDQTVNPSTIIADLGSQVIPLEGLLRYTASIVDPVYRQAKNIPQRLESGIPFLSKGLPAYTTPLGQPETRNLSNYVAPYAIGQSNSQFNNAFQSRQIKLNSNAIENNANKEIQAGQTPDFSQAKQVAPGIYKAPDGTFKYQLTDQNGNITIKSAKSQNVAQLDIAKQNVQNGENAQIVGNTVVYLDNKNNAVTLDLSNDLKTPTTATAKAIQDNNRFTDAEKVLRSSLPDAQKQQIYQKIGVDPKDVAYYDNASQNKDIKTTFVEEQLSNFQGNQSDLLNQLVQWRKDVAGKQLLSSDVITSLVNDGVISKQEGSLLNNITYKKDLSGQYQIKQTGRVSGGASVAKAPVSSSGVQVKFGKLPQIKLAAPTKISTPNVSFNTAFSPSGKIPTVPNFASKVTNNIKVSGIAPHVGLKGLTSKRNTYI